MNGNRLSDTKNLTNSVNISIKRYENHPVKVENSHLVTRKDNFSLNLGGMKKTEIF